MLDCNRVSTAHGRQWFAGMRRMVASAAMAGSLVSVALGAAPQAEAASSCVYYVRVFAYVHENPSTNSQIIAWDSAFTRLTGPCRTIGGFIAVYNSAARDGVGWVDRSKLYS
jgi:hypothetical protein